MECDEELVAELGITVDSKSEKEEEEEEEEEDIKETIAEMPVRVKDFLTFI
jgi:ribosome assembly protein YihI (activator of Der GTPase)